MILPVPQQTLFPGVGMPLPAAMVSPQPALVTAHLVDSLASLGAVGQSQLTEHVLHEVVEAFAGRRPGYLANDMRYHDLAHTLQAAVCTADLLVGQARTGGIPGFTVRLSELTLVAALLHDAGFLKAEGDQAGTGAKYTWTHEQRSCDFSRLLLPDLGVTPAEVDAVCAAIACTGPRNRISAQRFPSPVIRRLASLLVTADYLAQMAAPNYPDKLDALFAEFAEAFDHDHVPPAQRPHASAADLKQRTGTFWREFVRPMLDTEAEAVHRYLSVTGHPNPYLAAVEENLAVIHRRAQEESGHS